MKKLGLGFIETRGNAASVEAIDAMVKTADVELVKKVEIGSALVTAVVRGEVGAVKSAIEAGSERAARIGEVICVNVIPSAHDGVFELMDVEK